MCYGGVYINGGCTNTLNIYRDVVIAGGSGFSGNLLPVLVYNFKLRNICLRLVVNGAVLKYCTSS